MKYYKAINDKDMIFADRIKAPRLCKGRAIHRKRIEKAM